MDALDECNLHLDVLLSLFEHCDPACLFLLSQTCKVVSLECGHDRLWHKIFGPTLCTVPASAVSWKDRFRLRKLYPDVRSISTAVATSKPEFAQTLILPPGKYETTILEGIIKLPGVKFEFEGYLHDQFDEENDEEDSEAIERQGDGMPDETKPKNPSTRNPEDDRACLNGLAYIYFASAWRNLAFIGPNCGVRVHQGTVVLEDCIFIANSWSLVSYENADTFAKRCIFRDSQKIAAYTHDTGKLELEDCVFLQCHSAINLFKTSSLIARRCLISESGHAGSSAVWASGSTTLLLEDCTFERCVGLSAVWAKRASTDTETLSGLCTIRNCSVSSSTMTGILIYDIETLIEGCKLFRNALGIDGSSEFAVSSSSHRLHYAACFCAKEEGKSVRIINCEVLDHDSDGIFVHQGADVTISGTKVIGNKGMGIYISADSPRTLHDNEVYGNLGGDLCAQEFDTDVAAPKNDSTVCAQILEKINQNCCTFAFTGRHYFYQVWYHCRTCNLVDSEGLCESCRVVCHKGHDVDLSNIRRTVFFCDCGAALNCKCK